MLQKGSNFKWLLGGGGSVPVIQWKNIALVISQGGGGGGGGSVINLFYRGYSVTPQGGGSLYQHSYGNL